MSNNIEDFTDTSDVSDAAIEWVLEATGPSYFAVEGVRKGAAAGGATDCSRIIAARLVQRHCPELLVDPVTKLIREELAKASEQTGFEHVSKQYLSGYYDHTYPVEAAKRIYMLGLEKGRNGG